MAQMKTLAYELHMNGRCDPAECAWRDHSSVPPVHDRPQSVESGSNLTPGGDGGSDQWRVQTLGAADWVMRKVAKLDRESAAISDTAADEIDTMTKWRDSELARIAPQREHWTWLLADFHEKQLAEDPNAKTIKLAHGALVARKQPDNIEIENVKTALAWALACNDDYVRFPEPELNRSAIKAAVLKNGEIIPGVEVVEGQVKYSVAPS
jgi:phage host-nuclease inhibitor protein Gam